MPCFSYSSSRYENRHVFEIHARNFSPEEEKKFECLASAGPYANDLLQTKSRPDTADFLEIISWSLKGLRKCAASNFYTPLVTWKICAN